MTNILKKIISILLVLIMIACGYIIYKEYSGTIKQESEVKDIKKMIAKTVTLNERFNKDAFNNLKEQNSDFVAYLYIDDIIEQPIVQTTNNDYYLHRTFNKEWITNNGSPFMDYRNNLTDDNVVIYGHNNSYNQNIIFSRLNDIVNQDYYEKHSKITMYTDNEYREYDICYVYYIDNDMFQEYDFTQTTFFDKEDFDKFIALPKRNSLIKSIYGDIEFGDKILTLQTCKRLNQDVKVVVVAKENVRKDY